MNKKIFKYLNIEISRAEGSAGFVILFAVTISSILLAIALGVSNIALKEVKFGTDARETNNAFFAADSAVEYALFNDKPPLSLSSGSFNVTGLGSTGASCAIVTVDKTNPSETTIISKGYNDGGDEGGCAPGSNSVERELRITYNNVSPPPPPVSLNFDFEDGSTGFCPDNWICTGSAVIAATPGCVAASNKSGLQYLEAGCDSTLGTAKSQNFVLPFGIDHVRALRAGGADASTGSGWFVKKVSDDSILCSAQNGTNTDTFFNDDCTDLVSDAGTSVYIYVIDNVNSGWGKTYLDNIRLMDSDDSILSPE